MDEEAKGKVSGQLNVAFNGITAATLVSAVLSLGWYLRAVVEAAQQSKDDLHQVVAIVQQLPREFDENRKARDEDRRMILELDRRLINLESRRP